jgi:hypothetical protein
MNSGLSLALSEFSKGGWATEPSNEPPLHPSERNLIMRARLWLGKVVPLAFARFLVFFFHRRCCHLGLAVLRRRGQRGDC